MADTLAPPLFEPLPKAPPLGSLAPSVSPLFGGGGSPLLGTEESDLSPILTPIGQAEVNRTGGGTADPVTGALPTQKPKQSALVSSLAPLSAGIAAGGAQQPQTASAGEATAGVAVSTLGGAVSGALAGASIGAAGGPIGAAGGAVIGAISSLVISGTKAWFGVRNARKRNRQLKELQRKAEKQRQADIARNEKWARLNHFTNLRTAEDNRVQQLLQNKWTSYQNVASNMIGLVNSDKNLNQTLRNQMLGVS